jgi:sulfite reductase (NADPH) hemoprotein beta-component
LGGDRLGERLNIKYKDNIDEETILAELDNLFGLYKAGRVDGETFGDFAIRKGIVAA